MTKILAGRVPIAGLLAASLLLVLVVAVSACGSPGTSAAGTNQTATTLAETSTSGTEQTATTVAAAGSDPAPAFSGVTLDGKAVTLDQYRGKPLFLVYMTSG